MNTGDVILSPDCAHADDVSFGERMIIRGVRCQNESSSVIESYIAANGLRFFGGTYGTLAPAMKPISKQFNSAYLGSLALGFDPSIDDELLSRQTVINKSRRPAAKKLNSGMMNALPHRLGLGTRPYCTIMHNPCLMIWSQHWCTNNRCASEASMMPTTFLRRGLEEVPRTVTSSR